jgi:hypothetical protein
MPCITTVPNLSTFSTSLPLSLKFKNFKTLSTHWNSEFRRCSRHGCCEVFSYIRVGYSVVCWPGIQFYLLVEMFHSMYKDGTDQTAKSVNVEWQATRLPGFGWLRTYAIFISTNFQVGFKYRRTKLIYCIYLIGTTCFDLFWSSSGH